MLLRLDRREIERHCVGLAGAFLDGAAELGMHPVADGPRSHIAAVRLSEPEPIARHLREHGVRASVLTDRLRVGFHYCNDMSDVQRVLTALVAAR